MAEQAAAYLKAAASGRRLPPAQVLSAILALEKAKLPVRFTRLVKRTRLQGAVQFCQSL